MEFPSLVLVKTKQGSDTTKQNLTLHFEYRLNEVGITTVS